MRRFLGILLTCLASQAMGHRLEFVYINANEGTASGGHAAIRFDDEVFHFQHVPSGLLRITRDNYRWFRVLYGMAENRTIFTHRIEVTDDSWNLLRDGFNRRLLVEDEQFDQLESLEQDLRLLSLHLSASAGSSAPATIKLKGLGLFLEDDWDPGVVKSAVGLGNTSLQSLREAIERRQSADFLPNLSRRLRQRIETLQPDGVFPDPAQVEEDRFVPARVGYADRYTDELTALAALDVLKHGLDLRPGALLQHPALALNEGDLASLQTFRDQLANSLAELPIDRDSGWGFRLFVGMARLIAIDTSLTTKRLAVLDLGSDDAESPLNSDAGTAHARSLSLAQEEFRRSKQEFSRILNLDERAYGRLERTGNLLLHAYEAAGTAQHARTTRLNPLPIRPALARVIAPHMTRQSLAGHLANLKRVERAYRERLTNLYPYDLITNNCVSGIFRTVDRILGRQAATTGKDQTAAALRGESGRRLGGYVDSGAPNFIPFLAFQAVGKIWRVIETREIPSWRRSRLQEAYRRENPLWVDLNEFNILSSSLYRWHSGDAAFLFFSEDLPWLGPVTGTINAAVGLGQTLAGLFSCPWDHGHNLRQGAKGFLISLPEVFFFSIRKGSYPGFSAGAASLGLEPGE